MDRSQHALEAAGVEFTNGDQPGVRLSKAAAAQFTGSRPIVTARAARGKLSKAYREKR